MDDRPGVREGQPLAHPGHDLQLAIEREVGVRLEELVEVGALEQLHDDEGAPAVLAEVVDLDDVAMVELARRPRLAEKPLPGLVVPFEIP